MRSRGQAVRIARYTTTPLYRDAFSTTVLLQYLLRFTIFDDMNEGDVGENMRYGFLHILQYSCLTASDLLI